jgi:hypothetical protein
MELCNCVYKKETKISTQELPTIDYDNEIISFRNFFTKREFYYITIKTTQIDYDRVKLWKIDDNKVLILCNIYGSKIFYILNILKEDSPDGLYIEIPESLMSKPAINPDLDYMILMEENERLKKENSELKDKLSSITSIANSF